MVNSLKWEMKKKVKPKSKKQKNKFFPIILRQWRVGVGFIFFLNDDDDVLHLYNLHAHTHTKKHQIYGFYSAIQKKNRKHKNNHQTTTAAVN